MACILDAQKEIFSTDMEKHKTEQTTMRSFRQTVGISCCCDNNISFIEHFYTNSNSPFIPSILILGSTEVLLLEKFTQHLLSEQIYLIASQLRAKVYEFDVEVGAAGMKSFAAVK